MDWGLVGEFLPRFRFLFKTFQTGYSFVHHPLVLVAMLRCRLSTKVSFFLISRIVKRFNRKLCFLNTSKSRPVLSPPLPPPPPPPRKNNSNIELALKKRSKAYTCLNTHRNFITTMITSQRRARPKHCVNNLICISTYTTLKNTVETPRQTPEVLASWNFL